MKNQVSPEIKEKRSKRLIQLSINGKKAFQEKFIGQNRKVLWEEVDGEYIKGHTSNYILVYAKNNLSKENKIENVNIEAQYEDGLTGKVTEM